LIFRCNATFTFPTIHFPLRRYIISDTAPWCDCCAKKVQRAFILAEFINPDSRWLSLLILTAERIKETKMLTNNNSTSEKLSPTCNEMRGRFMSSVFGVKYENGKPLCDPNVPKSSKLLTRQQYHLPQPKKNVLL
jgi:hypothetical protein